ncbi:receptor kinase-like protein Xa21 [Coffea eugenioides]|uniref:receptor kinase-like protein Xa21 n=1 Tax=Coffea eugenioides TaxID=49369 RepID=UPI000F605398|nr:receptor kinase-like protein Xa21 [Coffea eugenioides]
MFCQNLQYLDISQNNFTGIISPHFLQTHSSLTYLKFGENSFSGSLPPEVGKLIHLADFNVSHNQLAGGIPISLADSSDLENLYMQSNFFQGTIPPNLASLKSIQQLDLSRNNLTGSIPKELEKLQFLRYLDLSYNDIEGEVPNTGVFSNASQISLIGNNKLCGGIPELEFPPCPLIKGKNRGKLKVIILLSIVLPATLLVLVFLLLPNNNMSRNKISEYGMGLVASTQGDVYSYGILLLEMITGRRPTDDIFVGDLDLHNYVNGALHERVPEILDPLLLLEGDENRNMTPGGETINGGREIDCIISLLKFGLKCSARLPNDRMHMNEAVRKLHLIKDVFLGVRVHQENFEA